MGSFFWGGLGKGIAGGMEKQQELQQKREESKLRTKMIDAQIKHFDAQTRIEDAKELRFRKLGETREAAGSAFKEAITGSTPGAPMIEEPGDPAIAPAQIQGQPGAGKIGRPMAPHEIVTHAMITDPTHAISGAALRGAGGGGGGIDRAFATPQEAMAFMGTPEYKALFPLGGRVQQTSRGWSIIGMNPSDPTANAFHAGLQGPGGRPAAEAARNQMQYSGAASTGAGGIAGKSAAELGEPIAPPPPFAGAPPPSYAVTPPQVAPGPMAPAAPPQVAPGPMAAPASAPLRAAEAKAKATKTGGQKAEAEEELVGLQDISGQIAELDHLSKQAFTTPGNTGYVGRLAAGAGQFLESFDPASPAGMYEARKQNVGEKLARGIGGVKGTATEGDIYRMLAALPRVPKYGVGVAESESSRSYKISAFNEIINQAIKSKQDYISGAPINLERSRKAFKDLVDKFVANRYVPGAAALSGGVPPPPQGWK